MRLIDADASIKYLQELRCKDCDKRKGMKNGKIRFCYEIGDAPCRACDIGDTIDYFLEEDISPTIDAVPVVRCKDCIHRGKAEKCVLAAIAAEKDLPLFMLDNRGEWYCADGKREAEEEKTERNEENVR